jgi:hypothetical protein
MTKPAERPMAASPALPAMPIVMDGGMDYAVDSIQRGILFWDAMRQRGNQYREQVSMDVPHVLSYETELVADGREMSPRANYLLARIVPPKGVKINPGKRPFVVVDPRAGHGPGIGGFKADSEIGVAMAAGNPCYFVGFLPDPVPGQTIADIAKGRKPASGCRRQAVRDWQLPGRLGGDDARRRAA